MRSYCVSLIDEIFKRTGIKFSQFEKIDLFDPAVATDTELKIIGSKPLFNDEIMDLGAGVGSVEVALSMEASKAERIIYSMLSIMMRSGVISFEKFDEATAILWSKSQSEVMADNFGIVPVLDTGGGQEFFF